MWFIKMSFYFYFLVKYQKDLSAWIVGPMCPFQWFSLFSTVIRDPREVFLGENFSFKVVLRFEVFSS